MPTARPKAAPDALIETFETSLLTHDAPPVVASLRNVVLPVQTLSVPDIGATGAATVIDTVLKHPPAIV